MEVLQCFFLSCYRTFQIKQLTLFRQPLIYQIFKQLSLSINQSQSIMLMILLIFQFYFIKNSYIYQALISMSLELIIQKIKALGCLSGNSLPNQEFIEDLQNSRNTNWSQQPFDQSGMDIRRFRVTFGPDTIVSKQIGIYTSPHQLIFDEPCIFVYDNHNHAHILNLELFVTHKFGDNSDIAKQINATVDLSQFQNINGEYIQTALTNFQGHNIGKLILIVEFFKKGTKYIEKVSSNIFVQEVQQKKQYLAVSMASKNIKNLIVNHNLTNFLTTINSLHLIFQKQDPEIFGRQCFLMIKHGTKIKTFSKITRVINKESVSWIEYHEFMKNDEAKFIFYFLYIDQYNNMFCKAIGEIRYVIYDETINNHTITMLDKKSNKYGNLMVKFQEKEVQKINLTYKLDKRMKEQVNRVQEAIQQHNRVKFEAKYNNHMLSQKQNELDIKKISEQQQKNKPLNPQQLKKNQMHQKFIEFLQKEVIKIQKQLLKKEQQNKMNQKKQLFLPLIKQVQTQRSNSPPMRKFNGGGSVEKDKSDLYLHKKRSTNLNKNLNTSLSTHQYRANKIKFPQI